MGKNIFAENPAEPPLVGERYTTRYPYAPGVLPPGLSGDHVCGTPAEWLDGLPWPYIGPPIEYDADGVPLCCGRGLAAFVASAGRPASVVEHVAEVSARASSAGRPASVVEHVAEVSARASSAGRPASVVEQTYTVPTRASSAGRPASVVELVPAIAGMASSAGRPASVVEHVAEVPTRASSAGRPASVVELVPAIAGMASSAGRPASVVELVPVIHGAASSAGRPASVVELVPSVMPTPGASCATAVPILIGTEYEYALPAAFAEHWFTFSIPASGNFKVTVSGIDGVISSLSIREGGACPMPTFAASILSGSSCASWSAASGATAWVQVVNFGAADPYTFVIESGTC